MFGSFNNYPMPPMFQPFARPMSPMFPSLPHMAAPMPPMSPSMYPMAPASSNMNWPMHPSFNSYSSLGSRPPANAFHYPINWNPAFNMPSVNQPKPEIAKPPSIIASSTLSPSSSISSSTSTVTFVPSTPANVVSNQPIFIPNRPTVLGSTMDKTTVTLFPPSPFTTRKLYGLRTNDDNAIPVETLKMSRHLADKLPWIQIPDSYYNFPKPFV